MPGFFLVYICLRRVPMLRVVLISLLLCVAVRAGGFSVTMNTTLPGVRWHGLVAAVSADGTTGYGL